MTTRLDMAVAGHMERLISRLANGKYKSALEILEASPALSEMLGEDRCALVVAFSRALGNCGWFDGDLGEIVGYAADRLIQDIKSYEANA